MYLHPLNVLPVIFSGKELALVVEVPVEMDAVQMEIVAHHMAGVVHLLNIALGIQVGTKANTKVIHL